jgi:hypothetical protein
MPSEAYPHPEEAPDRASLEGRKTVMQPFVTILAQPLCSTNCFQNSAGLA